MTKIFNKIKKKLSNNGSSLVLVIVALGFIGILTGALLTAVGYAYRQKLYDYNAKSNFYILEQAMDEIYAGIGSDTMTYMQEAYDETRESVVEYDLKSHSYKNVGDDIANSMFKDTFMFKISGSDAYNIDPDPDKGLVKKIRSFISNETVEFMYDDLKVEYYYNDGLIILNLLFFK